MTTVRPMEAVNLPARTVYTAPRERVFLRVADPRSFAQLPRVGQPR